MRSKVSWPSTLLGIVAAALMFFAPASARAHISVEPGTYEVPALVSPTKSGPVAIFNLRSLSECRVRLTGPVAENLKLGDSAKGLILKFEVTDKITGSRGEARLEETKSLGTSKIPLHVGNNLKPLSP